MKFKKLLLESSLSRIYSLYLKHDSGTISAFRHNFSKSENLSRSYRLKNILESKGYSVTKIDGVYIENYKSKNEKEVHEESYIVIDINDKGDLETVLRKLGEQFLQDSITFTKKVEIMNSLGQHHTKVKTNLGLVMEKESNLVNL